MAVVHIEFPGAEQRDFAMGASPMNSVNEFGGARHKGAGYYPAFEARRVVPSIDEREEKRAAVLRIAMEALLPTATLAALIVCSFFLVATPFPLLDSLLTQIRFETIQGVPGKWSLVLVPGCIFVIQLTSRRYGSEISFVQIVASWVLAVPLLLLWARVSDDTTGGLAPGGTLALGGALLVSQTAVALVFDGTRCVRWWQAPLASGLWASIAFAIIYYPLTVSVPAERLLDVFCLHVGLLSVASLLLLVPYWMLRRIIRPRGGYSGF
jgi:uncharacterized PurR-regulated membrane protein YhhQ (DUF165 family)